MREYPSLVGQRFGKLTVIEQLSSTPKGHRRWLCKCDCGGEYIAVTGSLTRGRATNCGCSKSPDLTGKVFGRLTVVGRSDRRNSQSMWMCRCECGNITYKTTDTLTDSNESMCPECNSRFITEKARKFAGFIEGTQISKIKNMTPGAANTSGWRGVYYDSKYDCYRAQIIFQRKRYYLGTYKNMEDAIKARKQAEKNLYGTFLEKNGGKMNETKDLKNQRFGRLTVIGDYITITNARNRQERKWLCRCECGIEKYVLERCLLYGGTKSCGCMKRINSAKANAHNLHGKIFEELKVLTIAKEHHKDTRGGVWWHCRCSCGNEIDVLASLLVTGRKTHCGCKADPQYYSVDITERRFGRLVAKYPLKDRDRKGGVVWHCVCECGNETDIPYNWLVHSGMQSCGCQRREHEQNLSTYLTHINGTSLDIIKSKKLPADNTTGYKGVYFIKGKYVAKIVFQKKAYYLGVYDEIEEAAQARKEAEEQLFDGAAAHYERWRAKADIDPQWAAENPVEIIVAKKNTSELEVTFLPVME